LEVAEGGRLLLAKAEERLGAIEDLLYAAGRMKCGVNNNTLPLDNLP